MAWTSGAGLYRPTGRTVEAPRLAPEIALGHGKPLAKPLEQRRPLSGLAWLAVPVVAGGATFLVHEYALQSFYVPSQSMAPTLVPGDRMLVDKLPWVRDNLHRGDIIVFKRAPGDPSTQYSDLVKRVIGLPGQTVSSKGTTLFVNGKPVPEPWLRDISSPLGKQWSCPEPAWGIHPTKIPQGQYFVLGDCRRVSYDSRYWGTVPAANVIGKVFLVYWHDGKPAFHWF